MSDGGPQSSRLIGKTVLGRYQVVRLLGEGGMGGVYECEHVEIGKHVAIKLVSSVHAKSPQIAARLKREARSTGALDSEHIVQVFDAGEDPELGLCLVMELLKGKDLATILENGKRLAPLDAAQVTIQASHGLEKAHEAGIVHRDLKPANIFVCQKDDGRAQVKVVDFGIAKIVRDAEVQAQQNPNLTRAGTVIGTPQYMSPEQAQGLDTLDHRTDVYSLGAVLFEMLTGEPPHPNMPTYEQTILQIVMKQPSRVSTKIGSVNVPPDLDDLVASMLSHEPNARPPSMRAVRAALGRIFPEIDNRRLAMASLLAGVSSLASSVYVPPSHPSLMAARAATGGSRGYAGAPTTGTLMMGHTPTSSPNLMMPAPTPSSSPNLVMPHHQSPQMQGHAPRTSAGVAIETDETPAGVPKKNTGVVIAVVGVVGLLAIVGVVGLLKSRNSNADQTATGITGVTGSASVSPSSSAPPKPTGSVAPSAVASASSAPPVASLAAKPQQRPLAPQTPPTPPASVAKIPKPPASATTTGGGNNPAPAASHPVGSTGYDDKF